MKSVSAALSARSSRWNQSQSIRPFAWLSVRLSAYVLTAAMLLLSGDSNAATPSNSSHANNSNHIAQTVPVVRRVVTIGFAGPLSGDSAGIGQSMAHAAEMALAEANAGDPHIDGIPVEFRLLTQDDQGNERIAALVAKYLVKAGAIAVVGHWQSTASLSAAPVYNAANIPQVSPGSSSMKLTANGFENVFRVVGHDGDISRHLIHFAQQNLHAKRIAVINDDTIYGTMLANLFSQDLQLKQGALVARHSISSKTSDFNAAMNDLKIKNPDLVFFGGLMAQAAVLQASLKRAHINASMIAAGGIVSPIYLSLTGATGEGTFGIATGLPQGSMNGWKKFHKKFVATYGDHIDYYAPFAYDAANVILAAIMQADSLLPAKLNQTLHNLKYKGLTGQISFDNQGNLNNAAYTVFRVQGGKWVPTQTYGGK